MLNLENSNHYAVDVPLTRWNVLYLSVMPPEHFEYTLQSSPCFVEGLLFRQLVKIIEQIDLIIGMVEVLKQELV